MQILDKHKERLMSRLEITPTCWNWTRCKTPAGYGQLLVNGKNEYTHRMSYQLFVGPLIPGMVLDHLCNNPACANPAHLEQVTQRINSLRGGGASATHARQTHCIHGHEFTPENTYIVTKRNGRDCRRCRRFHGLTHRAKRKAEAEL